MSSETKSSPEAWRALANPWTFGVLGCHQKNTITTRMTSSPMTPTHEVGLATINIHLHIHVHLHILQCWPIISLSAPSIVAHILGNILFKDTSVSAPELCFRLSHSDLEASVIEISESPTMEIGG